MLPLKPFVREHKTSIAIAIFICLFSVLHLVKPTLVYDESGGFREFGVGFRQKTVVSIWVVVIILAVFSYLAVLSYLKYSRT